MDTDTTPRWTLADRFRKVRQQLGLSQREMAKRLGVPGGSWSAWESGHNYPAGQRLVDVARDLQALSGVPADWVLGLRDADPEPQPRGRARKAAAAPEPRQAAPGPAPAFSAAP
jgi:transcriptional regulator with XRE-family HTH domain